MKKNCEIFYALETMGFCSIDVEREIWIFKNRDFQFNLSEMKSLWHLIASLSKNEYDRGFYSGKQKVIGKIESVIEKEGSAGKPPIKKE